MARGLVRASVYLSPVLDCQALCPELVYVLHLSMPRFYKNPRILSARGISSPTPVHARS